jgi:hypothetical protein
VHEKYLGDSFDVVKRFLAERLAAVAPLLAHPRFIPTRIRPAFERMMTIPILGAELPPMPFGLFLDPDTGIPLPDASVRVTASHAPLRFIADEFARLKPVYVVCFDQSHHRGCGMSRSEQRRRKQEALRAVGLESFYYVSHAPFLFAAAETDIIDSLRNRLVESGIPAWRLSE